MGSSKPKTVTPPDPGVQTAANKSQADLGAAYNRVNQTGPFGQSINYQQTGTDANGNPIFSANESLGDLGNQYATGLTGLGQQYFDLASNYDPSSFPMDAFNKAQGFYDEANAPYEAQTRDQLYSKLRNQGLDPSSEAFKNATMASEDQIARNRNAFTGDAQNQFFSQGLQGIGQQASLYNPGVQFGNTALASPNINIPQVNTGITPDVYGTQMQANIANTNAKNSATQGMWGGLAGLGGTLAGSILGGPIGGYLGSSLFGGSGGGFGSGKGGYL